MKKLLLLITLLLLASCGDQNNWKLTVNNWEWKKISHSGLVGAKISYWDVKTKLKIKSKKNTFVILKKELNKEFKNIWIPEDSNHYVNSCYLLLDTDYKNKQFVLYRNKWALVWTLWCKLDWVEKIWVLWYHNGKKDPDGEYILKSYDKETGMFKYVISEKYWNLWTWKNEYEFRLYLTGGKVLKEKVDKKINTKEFEKYEIYKIIKKEGCWAKNFDISKIPTESWWKIDLSDSCGQDMEVYAVTLEYEWSNKYFLFMGNMWTCPFYIYIKNWKITKKLYSYNNKLYKSVKDIFKKYCSPPSKNYNWYNINLSFVKNLKDLGSYSFYISGSNENIHCNFYKTKSNLVYCKDMYRIFNKWKKFKGLIKRYKNWWFLIYSDKWKLLKIQHDPEADAGWSSIGKTFLNWKEVK